MGRYTRKQYFRTFVKPYVMYEFESRILTQRFIEFEKAWCRTAPGYNMPIAYVAPKLFWRVLGGAPRWAPARSQHEAMWDAVCEHLQWNATVCGELEKNVTRIQAAFRAWKWRREVLWNPNTDVGERFARAQFASFRD